MSKKPPASAPELAPAKPKGGWPADEFTGLGGRYVRDPQTGVRRRAEPAPETPDAAIPASDE